MAPVYLLQWTQSWTVRRIYYVLTATFYSNVSVKLTGAYMKWQVGEKWLITNKSNMFKHKQAERLKKEEGMKVARILRM